MAASAFKDYRGDLASRFEAKTIPEPNSGCVLWLGACRDRGYGVLWKDGRLVTATHVALELAGRPVPEGMFALHHCDNPYCVNADHLFIGDAGANAQDAMRKGRQPRTEGRFSIFYPNSDFRRRRQG